MARVHEALPGKRFGSLVVVSNRMLTTEAGERRGAMCKCDCGVSLEVIVFQLGRSIFCCGCVKTAKALAAKKDKEDKESAKRAAKEEREASSGKSFTYTYAKWQSMWRRTNNPNEKSYAHYAAYVPVPEWRSFDRFLADMGECPPGHSLERKRNNERYGPDNCEWIPLSRQARNRSTTVWVIHKGEKMTLQEAAEIAGVSYGAVRQARYRKWPLERILGSDFAYSNE